MNGLRLKGGQASSEPHVIDGKHTTMTRQQRRRAGFHYHFRTLQDDFGGWTARGGHYWPEGMARRVAREIARDKLRMDQHA